MAMVHPRLGRGGEEGWCSSLGKGRVEASGSEKREFGKGHSGGLLKVFRQLGQKVEKTGHIYHLYYHHLTNLYLFVSMHIILPVPFGMF